MYSSEYLICYCCVYSYYCWTLYVRCVYVLVTQINLSFHTGRMNMHGGWRIYLFWTEINSYLVLMLWGEVLSSNSIVTVKQQLLYTHQFNYMTKNNSCRASVHIFESWSMLVYLKMIFYILCKCWFWLHIIIVSIVLCWVWNWKGSWEHVYVIEHFCITCSWLGPTK